MTVYVFGTGDYYRCYKHLYTEMEILGFIDNDSSKWGTKIDGHTIISPSEAIKTEFDYIFLASIYYRDMRKQLIDMGVSADKIIDKENRGFLKGLNQTEQYIFADNRKHDNIGKNVLMFSHVLNLTGAPVVFCRLAKVLRSEGYNVTVVAEKKSTIDHRVLLYQLLQEHISVIMVSDYSNFDVKEIADGYDMFWVCTVLLHEIVEQLKGYNKNIYWWLHETDDIYTKIKDELELTLSNNLYVLSGGWMAADSFKKHFGKKVFRNLMYGMPSIEEMRVKKDSNTKVKFGLIASYTVRKGQEILYEIAKKNCHKWKDTAEFYFVGSFPVDKKNKFESIGNMHVIGEMEPRKLVGFYDDIDVLIAPSLHDPMPVVVTEAMQHKRMCLVSDRVGQSRYITTKIDGLICEAGNKEDLEEKIDWIIDNRNVIGDMGIKSHAIYKRYFSMKSFEKNVVDLLRETL